jgi:hypothetical protein
MVEHGNLPADELLPKLRECDWGFSPMALTDDDPRYNRFSFPTKFISYLAAGLPLITLGHPESSVVKMAEKYQVGFCSTTNDFEKLGVDLMTAMSEVEAAAIYRPAILRCAKAEFDAEKMRRKLYECFAKCAGG